MGVKREPGHIRDVHHQRRGRGRPVSCRSQPSRWFRLPRSFPKSRVIGIENAPPPCAHSAAEQCQRSSHIARKTPGQRRTGSCWKQRHIQAICRQIQRRAHQSLARPWGKTATHAAICSGRCPMHAHLSATVSMGSPCTESMKYNSGEVEAFPVFQVQHNCLILCLAPATPNSTAAASNTPPVMLLTSQASDRYPHG